MKNLKLLLYLITLCLMFSSCGNDDNDDNTGQGNEEVNLNKNNVTTDAAVARLEFPRLKGGNNKVIVYRTNSAQYDKDRVNYSVEWDCDKKSQRWSCYILTTDNKKKNTERYYGDPQYPNDSKNLTTSQYIAQDHIYGSGFDHGHICPSNDRLYSSDANYQTFYMTNMQPQYSVFNGSDKNHKYKGLWINMESFVHNVKMIPGDTLFVCKGGTIDKEEHILKRISGKLIVPKYFFSAILLKNSQGYRALGFWFEHTNIYHGDDSLAGYAVTIDRLEELTGIDFFCNLPDNTENKVESSIALKAWGM